MTITAPTTGSLPRQRRAARHRDLACAAELDNETPEVWTMPCNARRCDGTCATWRSPSWSALKVQL